MGHSKGVRSDVWPLHDRKKRREGRDGHRWVTEKEQGMMYGHSTTERKEENEEMGIDGSLKRSKE